MPLWLGRQQQWQWQGQPLLLGWLQIYQQQGQGQPLVHMWQGPLITQAAPLMKRRSSMMMTAGLAA